MRQAHDRAERSHSAIRGRRRNHQRATQPTTANGSTPPRSLEDGVATAHMTGTLAAQARRAQEGRNRAHKPAAARTSAPPTSNPTSAYVWSGGSGEPQQFENWVAATPTSAQKTASVPSKPATRCTLLGRASITHHDVTWLTGLVSRVSRVAGSSDACGTPAMVGRVGRADELGSSDSGSGSTIRGRLGSHVYGVGVAGTSLM